jgi:hypothetical protein
MSTSEPSFQSQGRQRLFVAAALAVLALGAGSYGIRSRVALAEPASAAPPQAPMSTTPQSVQAHTADADADSGPGVCEPCVVGSPSLKRRIP